jgi:hypothetical protein
MKQVLRDALDLACNAGKYYRGAEDERLDPGSQDELRAIGDRIWWHAWQRLATLPGEAGDAARAELVAILVHKSRARGLVTSPGGGIGYLVGSCECPREFYAYEKEVQDCEKRGEDAIALTAAFFLDHCAKSHET